MEKSNFKIRLGNFLGSLFLGFMSFQSPDLIAQDLDHQYWLNYALKVEVDDRWSWGGDTGFRSLVSNFDWYQALVRPAVNYQFKESASVGAAVAWFGTFNQSDISINELRLHQELNAKWPDLDVVHLFYRLRIEERFFFYQRDIPNEFRVRLRGLIGVRSRDLTWFGEKRPIYLESMLEGFKTIKDEEALEILINQARFHVAFGHRISRKFHYELHYIYQGSTLFASDGPDTSQNIFRLRLIHEL
jgi:hypothetical protein